MISASSRGCWQIQGRDNVGSVRDTADGDRLAVAGAGRFDEAIAAHQDAAAFCQTGDRHREGIALGNIEAARAAQA